MPPTDRDINLANWNAWANVHGQDAYYDSASLIAGRDSLTGVEWAGVTEAIGDVAGRDVLHVQCHLAFDGITMARRGARVTGVDFSPAALAKARDLAGLCKVQLDLVEADVTDLPGSLHNRFDLAYATIGILTWIADVDAWMRSVAATLRPGGTLLLIDGHPFGGMIEGDPPTFQFPYANDGPHHSESGSSYAVEVSTSNVQYAHSLGEIVTAAADAGLRIRKLMEHLETPIEIAGLGPAAGDGADTSKGGAEGDHGNERQESRGGGEGNQDNASSRRKGDGRREPSVFRRLLGGHPVPLLYTLIADRPA